MPASPNGTRPAAPPTGYFPIWHRIFRGYGPAAVLVVVVVLVAALVPSRVPKASAVATGTQGSNNTAGINNSSSANNGVGGHSGAIASGSTGSTGGSAGTPGKAGTTGSAGSGGSAGSAGHSVSTPGQVESCGGQKSQVPGDPYSPPCELFSAGTNGGATATGITANAINVSFRLTTDQSFQQTLAQLAGASLRDTNADNERTILALANYFNSHFQFYGRKLVVHFYTGQGSLSNELLGNGQAQAQADALTAKSMGVFADLSAESEPYAADLANEHIMAFGDPYLSTQWHQQYAPYAWSIATEGTDVAQLAADYAVQKLCPAGSPAVYAGGALKGKPRKFALLAPENSWYQVSVQVAQQFMSAHGCPSNIYTYTLDLGTESQQAANLVAKMKSDGITTMLCGCDPIFPVYFGGQAFQNNYLPEFIDVGTALTDADYDAQLWNQQFAAHVLGISPNAPTTNYTQTLGYAAYKTVRTDEPSYFVNLIYEQMDQLAIGIQMAGPNLSPQGFAQGMFNFPARVGPYGQWGWGASQYTIPNDVREICYSPSTISPYNNKPGAFVGTSNQRWTFPNVPKGPPGCPIPS